MPLLNELLSPFEMRGIRMPLDNDAVNASISDVVLDDAEKLRRERAQLRTRLYCDGGEEDMQQYIESVFKDPDVKRLRKEFVGKAKYNNVVRRIVHELATVYQEPAIRKVAGDANNAAYEQAVREFRLDLVMREVDRLMVLQNDVVLGPRVRLERGIRQPVIEVIQPGDFWVLVDPLDITLAVAIVFDISRPNAGEHEPHFKLWTDDETMMLDAKAHIIAESRMSHGFPRMPWVLAHSVPPTLRGRANRQSGAVLDSETGGDVVAAHLNVWFQNVLLLKESKSANKQAAFTGDTTTTPVGQSQDSENDMVVGEGVTVQTVDRGMDLSQFRDNADHIEERAAGNHGIPPAILRHQGATSGHEIELRMLPIKGLRKERIMVMRQVERELAEVMAMVTQVDRPDIAFTTEDWRIDFGEIQAPLSPTERTTVFVADRRAGLTDTIEEIRRRNPDLDDAAARETMLLHIDREVERNLAMRPLAEIQGNMDGQPVQGDEGDESAADDAEDPDSLAKRANAVGILIRAGFDAEEAARVAGLENVPHLGLLPITLQDEEAT